MRNPQTITKLKTLFAYANSACMENMPLNQIDKLLSAAENAVILLRTLYEERTVNNSLTEETKPHSTVRYAGTLEVNEFGWLHITLYSLLPHCRYKTPKYLTDTLSRLIQEYTNKGGDLPFYEKAALIIEEHCDIQNRQVYDQDNKGWKAIPNVLKGNVIQDDDQFSLQITLLSVLDETPSCHIYVMNANDAGDFLSLKNGEYPPCF